MNIERALVGIRPDSHPEAYKILKSLQEDMVAPSQPVGLSLKVSTLRMLAKSLSPKTLNPAYGELQLLLRHMARVLEARAKVDSSWVRLRSVPDARARVGDHLSVQVKQATYPGTVGLTCFEVFAMAPILNEIHAILKTYSIMAEVEQGRLSIYL